MRFQGGFGSSTDGCVSVFLPNDDVSKARKLRMRRALEWGARRVGQWGLDTGITHIIADNDLTYKDVISYLKITTLPVSYPYLMSNRCIIL